MTKHILSDLGEKAIDDVKYELLTAAYVFPAMASPHEGFGIMYEEFVELQAHIFAKAGKRNTEEMRKEAVQVAAMAVRFIIDICENKNKAQR